MNKIIAQEKLQHLRLRWDIKFLKNFSNKFNEKGFDSQKR